MTPQEQLAEFMERTRRLSVDDLSHQKTIFHFLASMISELGEFAGELKIEEKVPGHGHRTVDEGTLGEGVDTVICALALYFGRGGTVEHLVEYGHKKLTKWENNIRKP